MESEGFRARSSFEVAEKEYQHVRERVCIGPEQGKHGAASVGASRRRARVERRDLGVRSLGFHERGGARHEGDGGGRSDDSAMATTSRSERRESEASAADRAGAVASREVLDPAASKERVAKQLGALPVVFVENDGQWQDEVKCGARDHGVSVAFTVQGMTLSTRARDSEGNESLHAVAF